MAAGSEAPPEQIGGYPLLAAKMSVPAFRTPALIHQRLLDTVSHGVADPLTVVSAAAGAGKTICWRHGQPPDWRPARSPG